MEYINFLGHLGSVNNGKECLKLIGALSEEDEISLDHINKYHETIENGIIYVSNEGNIVDRNSVANYMWVDTGYKTCDGDSIYASFFRGKIDFEGCYVGTKQTLLKYIEEYVGKRIKAREEIRKELENDILKTDNVEFGGKADFLNNAQTNKAFGNNLFCIDLYGKLAIKENWAKEKTGEGDKNRIVAYLDVIISKIRNNIRLNNNKGYIINRDCNKVVFNSGLLDKFLLDIYLMCEVKKDTKLTNIKLVGNKADLVDLKFDISDLKSMPAPIKLYKERKELLFEGDITDFNLEDRARLHHVINERKYRFPKNMQNMATDILTDKIINSVETALKMNERDYTYIVPMYNIKFDCIQYMIPLRLERSIQEVPELVIIISKENGFYSIMTILDIDDAYDDARVLGMLKNSWLKI